MNIARAANKYFNDEEPWKSIKSDHDKAAKTLNVCCQLVRTISIAMSPVIPYSSKYIQELLGLEAITGFPNEIGLKGIDHWKEALYPVLENGKEIKKPTILFSRIEDEFVESKKSQLGNKTEKSDKKSNPNKDMNEGIITIDDFFKVKLKTAIVLEAEKIKKSDKLLKLKVDVGDEDRQIIAGIAKFYEPEDIVGKTIVVVSNLKPAKLMGEKSEGMLLAANSSDGKVQVITLDGVSAGEEVR